jgi:hypothetical protein
MTVEENNHFKCVKIYSYNFTLDELKHLCYTKHISESHRVDLARFISGEIVDTFFVDKGHKDGAELHCVSENGVIWVLNERKWLTNRPCLVTVLFGRPNQVKRLYEACRLWYPQELIDRCIENQKCGLNEL